MYFFYFPYWTSPSYCTTYIILSRAEQYTDKSSCFFSTSNIQFSTQICHSALRYFTDSHNMQQISSQICISKFLHLRRHIGKTSICALDVIYLSLHLLRISLYILLILLAYCVNISAYCVYRLSSVPFSAYRFFDLGAYHITRFIRITQILEIYCSILKKYCTCCRVLQKYRILGEK